MGDVEPISNLHVVCPLQHERDLLRNAGVDRLATLHCCGPGPAAVERAVQALQLDPARDSIMLIGVAGGLSPNALPGGAHLITAVRDAPQTSALHPPIDACPAVQTPSCVVCSTELPVLTVEAKHELRRQSKADVVDTESQRFAETAQTLELRWGIIRGISDGANETLPAALIDCVDEDGATRLGAVARALLRRPTLVPTLLRLRKTSRRSMQRAAEIISALTDQKRAG